MGPKRRTTGFVKDCEVIANSMPIFFFLLALFGVAGCSGKSVDSESPESVYTDALEDIGDHRYSMAIDKLRDVKNRFPYSNYAKLAQLKIADIHFDDEAYIEAASAYETFRDLYPKYQNADYVLFRIGESYFLQLPSTVDRDLGPATKAVDTFKELRSLYPKSEYAASSADHEKICIEKLAEKEAYVANFYYKIGQFESAAQRFEKITKNFSNTVSEVLAYAGWLHSLLKIGRKDEANHVVDLFASRYPNAPELSNFRSDVENAGRHEPAK